MSGEGGESKECFHTDLLFGALVEWVVDSLPLHNALTMEEGETKQCAQKSDDSHSQCSPSSSEQCAQYYRKLERLDKQMN